MQAVPSPVVIPVWTSPASSPEDRRTKTYAPYPIVLSEVSFVCFAVTGLTRCNAHSLLWY